MMIRSPILAMCLLSCIGTATAAAPPIPTFFARRDYAGLHSQQVAVADTNGDGIPDLIASEGNVEVLFGNGYGTFRPGPSTHTGLRYAASLVATDLNGDGRIDLVIAGGPDGVNPPLGIGVCLGNGDGTFQGAVFYQAGNDTGVGNPVVGDFNGDGIPDAVVAGSSGIWLFTGKGDGTLNPGVLAFSLATEGGGGLVATDFNGDRKLDLVLTLPFAGPNGSGAGFVVLLGNGNGTFQVPQTFTKPQKPVGLAVGSLTKGGHPGIALSAGSYVYLYYGNGAGGFSGPKYVNLPGASGIALGDVNGDGIPDIVSSGGYIAFGTGVGTFTQPLVTPSRAPKVPSTSFLPTCERSG
jgi:hypothetical protein